jgi:hypothetical protein
VSRTNRTKKAPGAGEQSASQKTEPLTEAGEGKRRAVIAGKILLAFVFLFFLYACFYAEFFPFASKITVYNDAVAAKTEAPQPPPKPVLNKADYDKRMLALANNPPPPPVATSTATTSSSTPPAVTKPQLWPAKDNPYPNAGALLPFNRIVAYYGNFYSKQMGVLGEYPEDEVLAKLQATAQSWRDADPSTPVIPAIDYIAVTAQGSPGADGKYRVRMPDSQIDHALEMADRVGGIVVLDVQVGLSSLETEVPLLEKYLKMPNVELAIDPEFAMHNGSRPGTVIGSLDASDVNFVAEYLAKLVDENNLPPKVLVVHRFTQKMVTNAADIKPLPQVQVVMDMDGWGGPQLKKNSYRLTIYNEPVQFAGFKLFYKNDLLPPSTGMMTPEEVLDLQPKPIFIQYQ